MNLKSLVGIKDKPVAAEPRVVSITPEGDRKRTYFESGYGDSKNNNSDTTALKICLDAVYIKFENEERELVQKQEKLKEPYENEKHEKIGEIKGIEVAVSNSEESIEDLQEKKSECKHFISELKDTIDDIPENPQKYGLPIKRRNSSKFVIGLMVLIPLTAYLFLFYASIMYSVTVKEFTFNSTQWFVADALVKSWDKGFQGFAMVIAAPFIFLALGYLIHMFLQQKNVWANMKLIGVVLITLCFDILLAFFVEKKLWELNVIDQNERYGFEEAIQSQEFWLIIFLGFIAYIIWGFVFDFVMEEHKNSDKIKMAIYKRKMQISRKEEEIACTDAEIQEHREIIKELRKQTAGILNRIDELTRIIDGTIIPSREYQLFASEYVKGWVTFLSKHIVIPEKEKDTIMQRCFEVYQNHLKLNGVNGNTLNTVYTKTL